MSISPFETHRDMVLGHYSTAAWLRQLVMAMWNGSDYQVGLSQLAQVDDAHAKAAFDMMLGYRLNGERDKVFMALADEVRARQTKERAERLED